MLQIKAVFTSTSQNSVSYLSVMLLMTLVTMVHIIESKTAVVTFFPFQLLAYFGLKLQRIVMTKR